MLASTLYLVAAAWLSQSPVASAAATGGIPAGLEAIKAPDTGYTLSAADLLARAHAIATKGNWDAPADMPRITLEPGQALELGNLTKRSGNRYIAAYDGSGCQGTVLGSAYNFGCGTSCITVGRNAYSGLVNQQYSGNPYPTMDVWSGPGCAGAYQHFGINGLTSCTNSNTNGYRSFVGYWNC